MSTFEVLSLVAMFLGVLVAAAGVIYAGRQLKRSADANVLSAAANEKSAEANAQSAVANQLGAEANELAAQANKNANLVTVLTMENSLWSARLRVAEAATQQMDAARRHKEEDSETSDQLLKNAQLVYDEAKEQYLNVLDRLCACIVRGFVDEEVYRRDYRELIAETIRDHAPAFQVGTRHYNVVTVHEAWRDDRSAVANAG